MLDWLRWQLVKKIRVLLNRPSIHFGHFGHRIVLTIVSILQDLKLRCTTNKNLCINKSLTPTHGHQVTCQENDDNLEECFVKIVAASPSAHLKLGSNSWFKVSSIQEIFEIFTGLSGTYTLVGGNTAQGKSRFTLIKLTIYNIYYYTGSLSHRVRCSGKSEPSKDI